MSDLSSIFAYASLTEGASGVMTTGKGVAEVGFVGAALRVLGERGFAGVLALRVLVLRAGFAGVDLATVEAVGMQIQMHLTLISYRQ